MACSPSPPSMTGARRRWRSGATRWGSSLLRRDRWGPVVRIGRGALAAGDGGGAAVNARLCPPGSPSGRRTSPTERASSRGSTTLPPGHRLIVPREALRKPGRSRTERWHRFEVAEHRRGVHRGADGVGAGAPVMRSPWAPCSAAAWTRRCLSCDVAAAIDRGLEHPCGGLRARPRRPALGRQVQTWRPNTATTSRPIRIPSSLLDDAVVALQAPLTFGNEPALGLRVGWREHVTVVLGGEGVDEAFEVTESFKGIPWRRARRVQPRLVDQRRTASAARVVWAAAARG